MAKNKKILLVSVSTGSGHVRAAEALLGFAQKTSPEFDIKHIDMMDYVGPTLKNSIVESYEILAKQLPNLWGFFYKKTDRPNILSFMPTLSNVFNQANAGKFFKYIKQTRPDHILCTHFLPIYALDIVLKKNELPTSVSLLMTDYHTHFLQTSASVCHYFVSTPKMSWKLTQKGINEKSITISGIPIDSIFYQEKELSELRKKYNTDNGRKTILVLSGGQGLIKIDQIISSIAKTNKKLNIFAIAGNNKKLQESLKKIPTPENINLQIIGWTDKMDEYMRISDCIITKPGGLTTTECITLKKPIIAISPIPGQEEYNAEYILENDLGVIAHSPDDLLYFIENEQYTTLSKNKDQKNNLKMSSEIILEKIKEITNN